MLYMLYSCGRALSVHPTLDEAKQAAALIVQGLEWEATEHDWIGTYDGSGCMCIVRS